MGEETSIASLRSRISSLVDEEGVLVSQAFQASRDGADRRGLDALFVRIHALQAERNSLQKHIGALLGSERMHVAAEVWQPGVYAYRPKDGGEAVRVRVTQGPLGLQVLLPGHGEPVGIHTLHGAFDGPITADAAEERRQDADGPAP